MIETTMTRMITALEPQKRNPDRVNVYLDGEFAFGLARRVAEDLRIGATLSPAQVEELNAAEEEYDSIVERFDYFERQPTSEEREVRLGEFITSRQRVGDLRNQLYELTCPLS